MSVEMDQAKEKQPVIVVNNPRSQEELYRFEEPSLEDVDGIYDKAQAAFEKLRAMSVEARLEELGKIKRFLLENKEHLAQLIVNETGKSITDALVLDIFPVIDAIHYYEHKAPGILADQKVTTPLMLMGKQSKIFYEPMGPVLIISPWNYPFNLSMMPFVCAFIAGNPVILKPSKYTPLKVLYDEMLEKSGFMEGGLQLAYASRRTAGRLIEKRPAKIHFTGSVGVGRKIMQQASEFLIPVELELGGKDPMVVFDDVNLERTVNGALWGSFCNCGQTCTSVERIFVQEGVYDDFVRVFKEKAEKLRTLHAESWSKQEKELDIGSMTAEFQIEEIEAQLKEAQEKGAQILTGGRRQPGSHVFPPTIITNVDNSMQLQWEESFGAVATITKFSTEEEAIQLANDSPYGLSSSVWTADLARGERVARRLEAGSVSINNVMATHGNPALPFGGLKDSGFGRYKGATGLHAFSNVKAVIIDNQSKRLEAYWYPYSAEKFELLKQIMDRVFVHGVFAKISTLLLALKLDRLANKFRV